MEVQRLDRPDPPSVQKLDDPLAGAKTRVGAAIAAGFGARALKEFGDESQMGRVKSGKGVPDYLARIFLDPEAKYRFGVQWFDGDADVETSTTITIKRKRPLPVKADRMARKLLATDSEESE